MTAVPWKVATAALLTAVLALLATVVGIASARNEARRGRDSAVAMVSVLAGDLAQCRGNASRLETAVEEQGASIDSLRREAEARQRTGAAALAQAQITTREMQARNRVLQEIVNREKPETCDATFDLARRVRQ